MSNRLETHLNVWDLFYAAAEDGDYPGALNWLGSHQAAEGLVLLATEFWISDDELGDLVRNEWVRFDAHRHVREELLEILRRVAPISDTGRRLDGELVIYRGNLGEDPRLGLSWTLSRARARWFALYAADSPRASWLGLRRTDGGEPIATVWRATVDAADVLGYFGRRREFEVIPDPSTLRDVAVSLRPRPHREAPA